MGIVENIRAKYGDYLYYRAMSIPEWYIKRTSIKLEKNGLKSVDFAIDIFYSGSFKVGIKIDETGKIIANTCTCDDYKCNHICQHVLACILKKRDDFFTEEEISFQKSKDILAGFVSKDSLSANKAKEEIGLDIEIQMVFGNYVVKLKIGQKTKYSIKNRDKFNELIDSFKVYSI